MSELNPKKFEKEWQDAFEDAEMDVNPIVWDKIESKLAHPTKHNWKNMLRWVFLPLLLMIGLGLFIWLIPVSEKGKKAVSFEKAHPKFDKTPESTLHQNSKKSSVFSNDFEGSTNNKMSQKDIKQEKTELKTAYSTQAITRAEPDFVYQEKKSFIPHLENKELIFIDSSANQNILISNEAKILSKDSAFISNFQKNTAKEIWEKLKRKEFSNATQITLPKQAFSEKKTDIPSSPKNWISLQVGIGYYNPHWQANYETYLQNYIQAHNVENVIIDDFFKAKKEKAQITPSYQISLWLGRKLNERWQVRSGVMYQQWRNRFATNSYFTNYQDGTHYAFLSNIMSNQITNPNFVQAIQHHPNYQPTTMNYLELEKFNNQSEIILLNKTNYWSIPLQIGYTSSNTRFIRYTVWTGVNANIFKSHSSESSLIENNIQNRPQNKGIFRSFALDAIIGLEMEYRYHSNWSITFTPSYRKNIQSLVNSSYLKTDTELFNLDIGLKYKF